MNNGRNLGLARSERHAALDSFAAPDTRPAIHWLPCRDGPCEGGRKICPTPEACRQPDRTPPRRPESIGDWLLVVVAAVFIVAVGLLAVFWQAVRL